MVKKPAGYVVWKGVSQLDGTTPVVLIVTGLDGKGRNKKTGNFLIQSWILLENENPFQAIKDGTDIAICGDCSFRGNGCYVLPQKAPLQIWNKFKRGGYPEISPDALGEILYTEGFCIRIGSYGDPTAIPLEVWERIIKTAKTYNSGYSAQRHKSEFAGFSKFLMASCKSPAQAAFAISKGWRPFLVGIEEKPPVSFMQCPASKEYKEKTGKLITCEQCRACGGSDSKYTRPVWIKAHGGVVKLRQAQKMIQQLNVNI